MRAGASIEKHRKEPHVSLDQYVRACRVGLAKSLNDRRAVYLDSRYWILLREAFLGRETRPVIKELLELLRTQVYGGQTFCPISEAVFIELLKQEDLRTRRVTATLIDDLASALRSLRRTNALAQSSHTSSMPIEDREL